MKKREWLIMVVVSILALVVAASMVINFSSESNSSVSTSALEKGAQVLYTPVKSPPVTGPVEPTPLPFTPTPLAIATPIPTITTLLSTPTPLPDGGIIPRKIKIPAINVDTFVERVGVTREGNMDVPKNIWNTAWFGDGGYKPGSLGNAVIAGHLDAPGTRAVFWDLDKLKPGDKIIVSDAAGRSLTFGVTNSQIYQNNVAPLTTIFGSSVEPHLNLITCSGTFDRASSNYNKRLVVFSKLGS